MRSARTSGRRGRPPVQPFSTRCGSDWPCRAPPPGCGAGCCSRPRCPRPGLASWYGRRNGKGSAAGGARPAAAPDRRPPGSLARSSSGLGRRPGSPPSGVPARGGSPCVHRAGAGGGPGRGRSADRAAGGRPGGRGREAGPVRLLISFFIVLTAVLAVAGLAKWAFWPSRDLPVHRVRHTRIRLRLRLHPGPGFASAFECWLRWGRLASLRGSKRARPSLPFWHRLIRPAEHSVLGGPGHCRLRLRVPVQESITITAPPRAGKTGMLADLVLHFCGPVVATSVKSDIYELTSGLRAHHGPVAVFNPQAVSDLPSTFAWSPVAGCADPEVAARRAEAFTGAISVKGTEHEDFWAQQASEFFRAALMAADLAGGDMRLVGRWLMGSAEDAEAILERAGQDQWATSLAQLRSPAERTISTIRLLHNKALSFLGNPALAAAVLPGPGTAFDI